ncbi:MAG TPA: hypothetical protein VGM98_15050 [Schlesneria sp.]
MSRFLSLKSDPISQLAATDPLERQTWCSLRIQVGARFASRLWDKSLEDERDSIHVPAFPIAEWIVQNWWAIFNELCPWNTAPRSPAINADWLSWAKRHCLRAADSSLLLPKLYIYSDGSELVAEAHADRTGSLANLPGEFIGEIVETIDPSTTETALGKFIDQTIGRVDGVEDHRIVLLAKQWEAIRNADPEETEFCKLAGRMGLDPYCTQDITDRLAEFLETLGELESPLVRDLTESARPESVEAQWSWVNEASDELGLGPRTIDLPIDLPTIRETPAEYGYELARAVRLAANIRPTKAIESFENVAEAAIGRPFHVRYRNHLPGHGIKAICGQSKSGVFYAAGPEHPIHRNQNFTNARSLYHALATSQVSQRLVTDAYSLDQKASRAFAAELLAPREALLNGLARSTVDPVTVEKFSREFLVSPRVIELQLENAGILLSSD